VFASLLSRSLVKRGFDDDKATWTSTTARCTCKCARCNATRRDADAADASTSNATNARLDLAPGELRYAELRRRHRCFFNSTDLPFEMEVERQSSTPLVTSLPILIVAAISSTWDKLDCPVRSPPVFRSRQMSPMQSVAAFHSSLYILFLRHRITHGALFLAAIVSVRDGLYAK